jgi:hypothetical protein
MGLIRVNNVKLGSKKKLKKLRLFIINTEYMKSKQCAYSPGITQAIISWGYVDPDEIVKQVF